MVAAIQPHRTDGAAEATSTTTHVMIRLVQPGSWQPCAHCHETIEFVPGGRRAQATSKTYVGDAVQRVQHFHESCYRDIEVFYGDAF